MEKKLQIKHCLLVLFFLGIQVSLLAQNDYDTTPAEDTTTFNRDSLYHYWIKFPADTQATCINQLDIPGLEFEEKGCDLLAIGSSDDFFTAAEDSSCYKILRTYRIINWCEYNGQAAPVVVGRDWDDWNGTNPGRCGRAPDGNNVPGDSDFYVHVKRDFNDNAPDTVWYDADEDPYNNVPDYEPTDQLVEGYWWRVISGSSNRNIEAYYEGNCSTWSYDNNASDSDIAGNIAQDDNDHRYGSFGYWLYTQHITVYDDVAPAINMGGPDTFLTTSASECATSVLIPLSIGDSCSADDPTIRLTIDIDNDGTEDGEVTVLWDGNSFFTTLGLGEHRLIAEAFDNCGNRTEVEKIFSVVDGIAPGPICHDNLVAEIGEGESEGFPPIAVVWASDLVASNIFDCTGQSDSLRQGGNNLVTEYSINRVGKPADQNQKALEFFCGDQDTAAVQVEIHAWDEAGNHDFCTTEIEVQDNVNTCSSPIDFSGLIQTPDGAPFPNVDVKVSGGINFLVQTNAQGRFDVRILRSSENVSIKPSIQTDPTVGISTADLIRVQKHIVGNQPFDSPYQLLAADLDDNGRINFIDLIRIRKTILGMEDPTNYNENWLFIPANFAFQDPSKPWNDAIPNSLLVNGNMNFNQYQTDFWAVKIGDANGSAVAQVESRSQQKAQLLLPNMSLEGGQTYEIPIYLKNEHQYEGCQFALTWDTKAIEVLRVNTTSDQSAIHLDPKSGNHLKASWLNTSPASDKRIGSLQIRAKQTTSLSQVINIGDRYLAAEAYHSAFEIRPLELEFQAPVVDWSISENPFRVSSVLQFSEHMSGPLTIYDRGGRLVWQTVLNQTKQVEIRKTDLGAAGTYFFQVSHRGKRLSGQLISID